MTFGCQKCLPDPHDFPGEPHSPYPRHRPTSQRQLRQSVQDPAPQLYTMIFDLVFTPDPAKVLITAKYKPTHLLRDNTHSEILFPLRYYGSEDGFRCDSAGLLRQYS